MTRHAALLGALSAATLLAAPALARPMTPEDVARIAAVGDFAVSPDGTRIAYGVNRLPDVLGGEDNGTAETVLHLAAAPMSGTPYLPEGMEASDIRFSPDGRMLSFLHTPDGDDAHAAVYGIPVGGGSHRQLAAVADADIRAYAWAPDGQTLYLLAAAAPDETRDAESEAGFNAVVYEEEQRFNRLFAAAPGAEAEPRAIAVPGHVTDMRIAPDGRWAAVASAPSTLIDDSYTANRVHILDLADGEVRTVVETLGKIGDFEISPDGQTLSLVAGVDANDPAATTVHFVDAQSGDFRALNAGAAEAIVDTEWLADGRLATIVHVGAQSELRYYDAAGAVAGRVDPGALILRSIEAEGGRIAVQADSPRHPRELFALDGAGFTRWTNSNRWLEDIDFGTQRTLTYAARDGQQVEGILIEPVGGAPAGGAPTIMMIHGGPEAHYSNGWLTAYSMPGQVGAGRGYAVFHPNYRGSTAYGTAFSKQHQGNYTDPEFADIVDAIAPLAEAGVTDAERVGITGGSYGGYATAWGATALSEHFAAGVMFVGISNQISKFGTTDIPQEMYNVHSRQWPWEDWQGMLEVSPIYYAGQARTPLLILHGEDDTRVDPSQSYELYRNIKLRTDTPVRMVLYPGEGHGNQRAAARYDYNRRMIRWMDHYLMGEGGDPPPPRFELPEGVADED